MIGYYVHHQGTGHLARAKAICAHLDEPVTALSSLPIDAHDVFDDVVLLPRDDRPAVAADPTAEGTLHWVPRHDDGLRERMAMVSEWIAVHRPTVMVTDVSVEIALFARLHGVPVVTMVLPGLRIDQPHALVHRIADRLLAGWPRDIYDPVWLRPYQDKTDYVGGIGAYAHRGAIELRRNGSRPEILVLGSRGGCDFTADLVAECAAANPEFTWRTAGIEQWEADVWPLLSAADIVVSHAGQGAIADIAAAGKPAIVIPAARPFAEQDATAAALAQASLAVVTGSWPDPGEWPELIERARELDTGRWRQWRTRGAAARAAAVIANVAERATVS